MNIKLLEEIEMTNSNKKKQELLLQSDTEIHWYLEKCFRDTIENVSSSIVSKAIGYNQEEHGRFEDLGQFLEKNPVNTYTDTIKFKYLVETLLDNLHKSSENKIKLVKEAFKCCDRELQKWLCRLICKNPRIGINLATINKVRKKLNMKPIERFSVMLCGKIEPEHFDRLEFPVYADVKYDGERCVAYCHGDNVELFSRNGKSLNSAYPEIVEQLRIANVKIKLDGEIFGKTFNDTQHRMGVKEPSYELLRDYPVTYAVFDFAEQTEMDYLNRQVILEMFFEKVKLQNVKHVKPNRFLDKESLLDFYNRQVANGEEGIIVKLENSTYNNKREGWFKVKPKYTTDLKVIDVYFGSGKHKDYINSLLVQDKKGKYSCKVGSGITDLNREELTLLYNNNTLKGKIVEIEYSELTQNSIRFPRFIKIREDKDEVDVL